MHENGLGLALFKPPYQSFEVIRELCNELPSEPGTSVIWRYGGNGKQQREYEALLGRPPTLPLVIYAPGFQIATQHASTLHDLEILKPKAVLPDEGEPSAKRVREVLRRRPADWADVCAVRLEPYCGGKDPDLAIHLVKQLIRMAKDVPSIRIAAKRLYTSRRTLGRRLSDAGMPKPSHILQFARLVTAVIEMQADGITVGRAAIRLGYPDGFTLSNQMVRLIGVRPSSAKQVLGWEWLLDKWIAREGLERRVVWSA